MTGTLLIASLLATLQAGADQAPVTSPAPPASAVSAAVKPKHAGTGGQIVCHEEDTTGSRLGAHRTCRTRDEWRALASDSTNDFNEELRRSRSGNFGGS